MRIPEIMALAALVPAALFGRPDSSVVYSLREILLIAGENSDQLKIIASQNEAGRQQVRFYRSEAYPMVSFSAGATVASQSNQQSSAGGMYDALEEIFRMMPPDTSAGGGGASYSAPDRLTGTNYNWGLTVSQPLVTFGRVGNALKLAGMQDSVLDLTAEMQENVLYLSTMSAFSEAYLAQRQLEIAEKSLATAKRLMERTKVEVANGAGSRLDYLTAEARYGGARAEFLTAQSNRVISRRRLSRLIGFERPDGYRVTLDGAGEFAQPPEERKGLSVEYTLKGLESGMRSAQAKYERSKLFPSIYLAGGLNSSAYYSLDDDKSANAANDALVDPDNFNYSIGLQLSWSLFDGFRTVSAKRQAEAQARVAELEQKQIGEKDQIAIQEGFERLGVIEESIEAVSAQLDASRRAFELADEDFTRGYVDMTTYLDTEKKLREAETRLSSLQMQKILTVAQLKFTMGLPVYEGSR